MKKLGLISIICIAFAMCLAGCGPSAVNAEDGGDERQISAKGKEEVVNSPSKEESEKDSSSEWLSVDEMLQSPEGTFVERNGLYLCLTSSEENHYSENFIWAKEGASWYRDVDATNTNDSAFRPLFTFEPGDRIVSTEETSGIIFYYIEDEGYCSIAPGFSGGILGRNSKFDDLDFDDGKAPEEIAGVELGNIDDENRSEVVMAALEAKGIKMSKEGAYYAPDKTTVQAGYFEGTKWVNSGIAFNKPFIDVNSGGSEACPDDETASALILPEKTKDGYFIYDFSESVEPGSYVMSATLETAYKVIVQ